MTGSDIACMHHKAYDKSDQQEMDFKILSIVSDLGSYPKDTVPNKKQNKTQM